MSDSAGLEARVAALEARLEKVANEVAESSERLGLSSRSRELFRNPARTGAATTDSSAPHDG